MDRFSVVRHGPALFVLHLVHTTFQVGGLLQARMSAHLSRIVGLQGVGGQVFDSAPHFFFRIKRLDQSGDTDSEQAANEDAHSPQPEWCIDLASRVDDISQNQAEKFPHESP